MAWGRNMRKIQGAIWVQSGCNLGAIRVQSGCNLGAILALDAMEALPEVLWLPPRGFRKGDVLDHLWAWRVGQKLHPKTPSGKVSKFWYEFEVGSYQNGMRQKHG